MTAAELRQRIAAANADVDAAVARGDVAAARRAQAMAYAYGVLLGDLEAPKQRVKLSAEMVVAERLRVSGGRGRKNPLVVAANKAGYTQRSLAEKVGVSHTLLSRARDGHESISLEVAKKVELLTGFAATKAHWPKLRG